MLRDGECLKKKLNIGVGQSAYAYIVCDPLRVLEKDEVHLGFSTTFFDLQMRFQDTIFQGTDVLVARSPAHLPSDIQKVRIPIMLLSTAHRNTDVGCLQT